MVSALLLPVALAFAPGAARAAADSTAVDAMPDRRWRAWQTGLVRADRLQHASLSVTLGIGAGVASREPMIAVAAPLALGLAKELVDARGPGFDGLDLLADLAGAAAAGWFTARRLAR